MRRSGIRMKMMSVLTAVIFTVGLMPVCTVPVQAEEQDLSVSGTEGGYTYDENGNVTITNDGTYTITGTGDTTSDTISVASGLQNVNITLDNVNIDATNSTTSSSAFKLVFNNNVNINLSGGNTLTGCDGEPGLEANNGSKLTISGSGSLKAVGGNSAAGIGGGEDNGSCGNIVISSGMVAAEGSDGAADIGHGSGSSDDGSLVITGGSVNADNIGPSTVYYDTDQTTPAYLTKVTVGETPVASENVIYNIYGSGLGCIGTSTDENGILYLWLPESSSTKVDVVPASCSAAYEGSGTVAADYNNEFTADILPIKITSLPTASEIDSGSPLSDSALTGGYVSCDSDNVNVEIFGKFAWTNPDTVVTSSGNYSVTFTPNCKDYENLTGMVYVMVKNGSGTTELSINDGSVKISLPGDYIITGTGEPTSNTITVDSGVKGVNITLDNVNIDASSAYCGALVLDSDNDVSLTLAGDNILKSGDEYAGIKVEDGSSLTISGDGSLTANGGEDGAGIGGNGDPLSSAGNCGDITINGGVISATGGNSGAGIGGGGTVMGIGGGNGGNVIINGGTVVSTGGISAADIGAGSTVGTPSDGTLIITGGSVNADSIGPTVYYDTDQTIPAYLTKVTVGTAYKTRNAAVTYKINGGSDIKSSTDENGILYLWLPAGSATADVTAGGMVYEASGTIAASNDNAMTALAIPKISALPSASNVNSGDKLSASTLSDGMVTGVYDETISGKFAWTNPDTVVTASGKYSAIFTPDSADYKSVTAMVTVSIKNGDGVVEYTINDGSVEINAPGNYHIYGTGEPTSNTITVNKFIREVNITLDNVNIDASQTNSSALSLELDDGVFLTIKGDNILKSGNLCAGIKVDSSSSLYISENSTGDKADGTLTAVGGDKGAGIGGSASDNNCGEVISQESFVNATGGSGAAGIGGGAGGDGGSINILGGAVEAKGGDGAADIGHGAGSTNDGSVTIECGSVRADNIGSGTVYYDYNKTTPAYLTKVSLGVNPLKSQYVTYVCNDSGSVSSATDENGVFYLWLPSGSAKFYFFVGNDLYEVQGTVSASDDNTMTATAITMITEYPTASYIASGSKLSEASITGGKVIGSHGNEVAGKFAWTNPDTVVSATGNYSVTFTPDNPNYKSATADVFLQVKNDSGKIAYSINNGSVNIHSSGDYIISGNGTPTSNTINIGYGASDVNITLDNVDIESSDSCAFSTFTGNVNLTLEGENVLKSGGGGAGLQVEYVNLTISGGGSLTATGGSMGGAGIGGSSTSYGHSCGTVTILGGIIKATGSKGGAGIGGGSLLAAGGGGGIITVNGGTVVAVADFNFAGAEDIGGGIDCDDTQGTLTVTGGSVKADRIGPSTVYCDANQSPAYLTKVTVGATPVASEDVTYTINGGSQIETSTDENGIIYLWLPVGSATVDITSGKTVYEATGKIAASNDNKMTALAVPVITALPSASAISFGSSLSASLLTGGTVTGLNDATLAGKFAWTNPDTAATSTGQYSVTFTPDSKDYKSVTAKVSVTVINSGGKTLYSINNGSVEIDSPGNYIITGDGTPTPNTIKVDKSLKGVNITLDNVNIDASGTNLSALSLEGDDYVFLTINGENIIKGGNSGAGIKADSSSNLYIYEDSSEKEAGLLTAVGGDKGAGIGGSGNASDNSCGAISFSGVSVNATGGTGASGIGGGYGGDGGNVKFLGGTVTAKGAGGAADIGHGSGSINDGSAIITCGSVKAENMGPDVYCDDNKTIPAYLTKVTLGVNPLKSQYMTYSFDSLKDSASCSTDENGIVYLWLESGSATLDFHMDNALYEAKGTISASDDNTLTAMADSKITALPVSSSVRYGLKLSDSSLTGGTAEDIYGNDLKGTFTWDNPDTTAKTSGNYSVIFTPDNPNYNCAKAMVNVTVIKEDDSDDSGSSSGGNTGTTPTSGGTGTDTTPTSGGNTGTIPQSGVTTTTTSQATIGSDGTATADVSENQINNALAEATQQGANANVEINVSGADSASVVSAVIPSSALETLTGNGENTLTVHAAGASVTFDKTALETIEKSAGDSVTVSISAVDTSSLTSEERAKIGNSPVYRLTVTSNGNISNFGNGTVTVSLPYTLAAGENPNDVVVYYITDSGELMAMPYCVYDASKGMAVFNTNHFSDYITAYNDVKFDDVSGWCKDYVDFLAARNIMSGCGENMFNPNGNITRAQFVTILAQLSGEDLENTASAFNDVSSKDWYAKDVQWAYEKGIVKGTDGNFNPNSPVTREQMAAMLYSFAKYAGFDVSNTDSTEIKKFADCKNISDWALMPVGWAMNLGVLSGDGSGRFNPQTCATRAEAAKVMAVFVQDVISKKV